jgi:hypothetical protein
MLLLLKRLSNTIVAMVVVAGKRGMVADFQIKF